MVESAHCRSATLAHNVTDGRGADHPIADQGSAPAGRIPGVRRRLCLAARPGSPDAGLGRVVLRPLRARRRRPRRSTSHVDARPGRVLDFRRPHPNRQDDTVEGRDRLLPVKNPSRLHHGRIQLQRRCRQQAARNMGGKAPLGRRRRHKRRLVLFDRRPGQPTQRLSRPRAGAAITSAMAGRQA